MPTNSTSIDRRSNRTHTTRQLKIVEIFLLKSPISEIEQPVHTRYPQWNATNAENDAYYDAPRMTCHSLHNRTMSRVDSSKSQLLLNAPRKLCPTPDPPLPYQTLKLTPFGIYSASCCLKTRRRECKSEEEAKKQFMVMEY